jgi:hypothetical protein
MGDVIRQINKKDRKCPSMPQSCERIKNKLRIHVRQWMEIGHKTPKSWKTITKKIHGRYLIYFGPKTPKSCKLWRHSGTWMELFIPLSQIYDEDQSATDF